MPKIPPPAYVLAAGLLQRALVADRRPGTARRVAAGALAATSVGFDIAAAGYFRRSRTTVNPLAPDRATGLVTSGPNALTRNPMYVGMAGLLTAHAILLGSWRAVVPVAGFVAVIDRFQIRPEEQALQRIFGEEYDAYRRGVPRWLGRRG